MRMLTWVALLTACHVQVDPATVDADGDGFSAATDCDDSDPDIHPNADELCDGVDNDCDDQIDEDGAIDGTSWYPDSDGDGLGANSELYAHTACSQPTDYVSNADDCDDTDASVGSELTWYTDADGDGYGDEDAPVVDCHAPAGTVGNADDCDDSDPSVTDGTDWYHDGDGDGHGDPDDVLRGCTQPRDDYVTSNGDCDDNDVTVHPYAEEVCDDKDNNCDGVWANCLLLEDTADIALQGQNEGDQVGDDIAAVGDITGDGADDFVLAAVKVDVSKAGDESETGRVYVVTGPLSAVGSISLDDVSLSIDSNQALTDTSVFHASGAGDMNGDGVDDLAIAATGAAWAQHGDGTLYLFLGPVSATDFDAADYVYYGSADWDGSTQRANYLGGGLSSGGDIDGDGLADLLIGGVGYSAEDRGEAGAIMAVWGSELAEGVDVTPMDDAHRLFYGATENERTGQHVAMVPDVNGDGYDEVIIGSYRYEDSDRGAAFVFMGPITPLAASRGLDEADGVFTGGDPDDWAGQQVGGMDADGDGHTDLVVSVPREDDGGNSNTGAIYVMHGNTEGTWLSGALYSVADTAIRGTWSETKFGNGLDVGGDHNGDGYADLVTGSKTGSRCEHGVAWLFTGPLSTGSLSAEDAAMTYEGGDSDDAGENVAFVGAMGGTADAIAVGAPASDLGADGAGTVFIQLDTTLGDR